MTRVLAQQGRGRLWRRRVSQKGGLSEEESEVGIHVFILKILAIRTWVNQMT